MRIDNYEFELVDDGTLDTVVSIRNTDTDVTHEYRYLDTSAYRDEDGYLYFDQFVRDYVWDDISDDEFADPDPHNARNQV